MATCRRRTHPLYTTPSRNMYPQSPSYGRLHHLNHPRNRIADMDMVSNSSNNNKGRRALEEPMASTQPSEAS